MKLNKISLQNSPNLVAFPFVHATVLYDEDGTVTGHTGGRVLPYMGTLDPALCTKEEKASFGGVEGKK